MNTMTVDNMTEGEHVDPLWQRSSGGVAVVDDDGLLSFCEV